MDNFLFASLAVILSFAELQGLCDLDGRFGASCKLKCHCLNNTKCDSDTGQCTHDCLPGWSGHSCQKENIALNSNTFQKDGRGSIDSSLAVDNDIKTCSASKSGVSGWWTIGLHQKQYVHTIEILAEENTSLHGWKIVVGDNSNIFNMRICSTLGVYKNKAQVTCETPEQARYITVINPAGPVIICEFQVFVCSVGSFGIDCEHECACMDPTERCDVIYGTCSRSGCRSGRSGTDCQTECVSTYGPNCIRKCGHCVNGMNCNPESGVCGHGCQKGWYGNKCDKICMDGLYGANCTKHCGHCYDNEICDPVNGTCTGGCQVGWTGQNCDKECDNGFYGENCAFKCGQCSGQTCDPFTGKCNGCLPGWKGRFCTHPCELGSFGYNCGNSCLNCEETLCDPKTGDCKLGCQPGWRGRTCNISCSLGKFGRDCNFTCGRCKNGDCSNINGTCLMGCQTGYTGELCNKECPDTYYGDMCLSECGICKKKVPCDKITGHCPDDCFIGYTGELCTEKVKFTDKAGTQMASFLGISVPIVVLTMSLLICCLIFKWRQEDVFDITTQAEKERLSPETQA